DPFWLGHLKKYQINADGSVGGEIWDAGEVLKNQNAGSRNMFTLIGGARTDFTNSNITASTLGVATDTDRDKVVGYFRGESSYNPEDWKLGDVFRATPINVGTPSPYYFDARDQNQAFATFRDNHPRTTGNGLRLVVSGANDGQLHAFRTSDGSEAWSFMPPNLLTKLKNVAHTVHPTALSHQYFVDGPVTVADVWWGSGDGTAKSAGDWKTILITAEGRGGSTLLWSGSQNCDSSCAATYNAATSPYYCGFWAFNVTNTTTPVYVWHLNPTSAQAPYLGDPWSKFYIGRVKIGGNEKWVGFIGGGYNGGDCSGGGDCDTRGKGFFVVDLQTGDILWSYTMANDASMAYSLAASPAIADTDNDNFIDTAYIGDLGGSVWRIRFCSSAQDASCNTANWSGGKFFDSSTGAIRPIYTTPSVTLDSRGQLWVYFGSGDKMDPTAANAQEKFYALKDLDFTSTWRINDLENITSGTFTDGTDKHGWYINLAGQGEKILADSAVFGNVAYFTTYTPPSGADPCSQAGTASLYAVNFVSGGGILAGGRSMSIGVGVPTAPVLSFKPGGGGSPDLYVTVSGGGGQNASTLRAPMNPPSVANRTNILFWRDMRL
ncbi:MAG: PilC/PilY family type IV pilus protein, partial [Deltaproteobacteria bacterium]|nr:PilC/PilY family type IV pilus protein [Deltaproteobacteria bacterium]